MSKVTVTTGTRGYSPTTRTEAGLRFLDLLEALDEAAKSAGVEVDWSELDVWTYSDDVEDRSFADSASVVHARQVIEISAEAR